MKRIKGDKMKAIDFIKDSKQTFVKEDVVIEANNGKEYTVGVWKKLKDTSIMALVDDVVLRSEMCKKENIKFDVVMSMYALIVKYFTDIQFSTYPNLKKQFSHELDMLKAMIDLGVFEHLIKEFDADEIKKIQDAFEKYGESFKSISNNIIAQEALGGEEVEQV